MPLVPTEPSGIFTYAVVSGSDHDSLMAAIEPYQMTALYGNMDPDCEEWLVATIKIPRRMITMVSQSLQTDYHLTVALCRDAKEAENAVRMHPAWD